MNICQCHDVKSFFHLVLSSQVSGANFPVDAGRILNEHKTFNLRPVSTEAV